MALWTDINYELLCSLFAGERVAGSTADMPDDVMDAMRASRTPPEHDYDYEDDD
jgi:hypothetical protein